MAPKKQPDLLTILQAARLLKISRQRVYELIESGTLAPQSYGHIRLIPRQAALKYKRTRKAGRPKTKS